MGNEDIMGSTLVRQAGDDFLVACTYIVLSYQNK